jgi:hypothetical protein
MVLRLRDSSSFAALRMTRGRRSFAALRITAEALKECPR